MTKVYSGIPPPISENFRFGMTKVYSRILPPTDYCDAQAGFWLHSKFWSKFSRKPLSGISDQKAPPFSENFKFGMTKVYSGIPPPISENFRFGMTKVYSRILPPTDYCDAQAGFWLHSKFWSKFSRKPLSGISDQKALPPLRKLQIWDDQSLLRNTPPFRKTSDLG